MDILEKLKSGQLHQAARESRPDCVDRLGNVHRTPERAKFVDWRAGIVDQFGEDPNTWSSEVRAKYAERYVAR